MNFTTVACRYPSNPIKLERSCRRCIESTRQPNNQGNLRSWTFSLIPALDPISYRFELVIVAQFPNFRGVRLSMQFRESSDVLQKVGLVEDFEQKVFGKWGTIILPGVGVEWLESALVLLVLSFVETQEGPNDDVGATGAPIEGVRRRRDLLMTGQKTANLYFKIDWLGGF